MNYIRAFIAGVALPSIILPILLCVALAFKKTQVLAVPFLHFIPLIWGIWNILYIEYFKKIIPGDINTRLSVTGAVLGFLVAAYAIFCLNMPKLIGLPGSLRYLPLIGAPILYAVLWRFVIKPLNELVGIEETKQG